MSSRFYLPYFLYINSKKSYTPKAEKLLQVKHQQMYWKEAS